MIILDDISIALKYMYNGSDLKTKQDCIDRLSELKAYYKMDGQDFDFGTGIIKNDLSLGYEFWFYEQDMMVLEYIIKDWDKLSDKINYDEMDIDEREQCFEYWYPPIKHNKKQRKNRYATNRKHKDNMLKRIDNDWYPVWHSRNELEYGKRYYRGKRSKLLKKQSSKIIRKHEGEFQKKGNKHKRVFDFWWEMD